MGKEEEESRVAMEEASGASGRVRGFDHVFKVVVIGESGVGKSSIVSVFADEPYIEDRSCTIAADIRSVSISAKNGKRIKCLVWDTAGQERYRSLTGAYYRGAQLGLLCFDITNYDSFKSLDAWMSDIRSNYSTHSDIVLLLIGTKLDKADGKRVVTEEEAKAFCSANEIGAYIETSARTGVGVKEAFRDGVDRVLDTPALINTAPTVITLSTRVDEHDEGVWYSTKVRGVSSSCC